MGALFFRWFYFGGWGKGCNFTNAMAMVSWLSWKWLLLLHSFNDFFAALDE